MTARWPAPNRPAETPDPSPQLTLTEYRDAVVAAAKDAGTTTARKGDPDLYAAALEVIERWAERGAVFSADDVVADLAGVAGPAVGSAFRAAASAGIIRAFGVTTTSRVSSHGRLLRLWIGAGATP